MIFASGLFAVLSLIGFSMMTYGIFFSSEDSHRLYGTWLFFLIILAISGGVLTSTTNFFNCGG